VWYGDWSSDVCSSDLFRPFEEGSVLVQSGRSQNERLWNGRF
jgi:hypothetical protein